jgi:dephospho-CoA kinase
MLIVGLTGGIGSGKTAVSNAFTRLGVPVIDTDILAREAVEPGQPALQQIINQFGPACLKASGTLDRDYLRRVVFADPVLRKHLETILHPRILELLKERIATLDAPYCVVVIPLLAETGMAGLVHRTLVVDVPENLQIRRIIVRDAMDEEQARRILAVQANRAQRLALANDIIDNSGDFAELEAKVTALHQHYLALATN